MPSALYAISHKATRSLLALCSFEKRDLVDSAAWDQLLASLVGARLPISISGGAPIEIDASELGCDLVTNLSPLELEPVLADPYAYRVSVDPAGAVVQPGDGKEKALKSAGKYRVTAIALTAGTEQSVTVTLKAAPLTNLTAQLLLEG